MISRFGDFNILPKILIYGAKTEDFSVNTRLEPRISDTIYQFTFG